jgi:GTP cyclohydrolase I
MSANEPKPAAPDRVSAETMPDVQASADSRRVAIDKVGVKEVVYPIRLHTKAGGEQTTVANLNMYVALPHHQKGTHMSRFLEVLNEHSCQPLTPDDIPRVTEAIRVRLHAAEAHFEASFTYFIEKHAPVTGAAGLMNYEVTFECTATATGQDMILRVAAPATSLCPCSKEISEYGAHNQRCRIEAAIRTEGDMLWIEDLASRLEEAASHPVYAVLKRPDEKFVTEKAYDNPKFVEDIIRDLAVILDGDDSISWYRITSENFESIHSHNAYAQIEKDTRG